MDIAGPQLTVPEVAALALEAEQRMIGWSPSLGRVVADARLLLFAVDHQHGRVHIEDDSLWWPWPNGEAVKKAIMQSPHPGQCFRSDAQQEPSQARGIRIAWQSGQILKHTILAQQLSRLDPFQTQNQGKVRAKTAASESSSGPDKRSKAPQIFKNILCGIDFEDSSLTALRLARQIALQNDSTVYLIHVRQTMVVPMGGVVTNPPLRDAVVRARLRTLASEHLVGIDHYEVVSSDDPAKALLKTADQLKVDLIVIGTRGRRVFRVFCWAALPNRLFAKPHVQF